MSPAPFDAAVVEGLADVLGATETGFTGGEIARLLERLHIPDPGEMTKRHRITEALLTEQRRTGSGSCVAAFVMAAMKPVSWSNAQSAFDEKRQQLNAVFAYAGVELRPDGVLYRRPVARTHDDATATSRRLRDELQRRGGHAEVFRYCTRELVAEDCFGAVFEATKGLAERLRQLTGLDEDGHRLVDAALGSSSAGPMVAFNTLRTDTERNEQRGLASIIKGVFSAFRNPTAHEPRLFWHVSEPDALDLLSTLSLVHRRLDAAAVLRTTSP